MPSKANPTLPAPLLLGGQNPLTEILIWHLIDSKQFHPAPLLQWQQHIDFLVFSFVISFFAVKEDTGHCMQYLKLDSLIPTRRLQLD